MSVLYDGNEISYILRDVAYKPAIDTQEVYQDINFVTEEVQEKVNKHFPFSKECPKWVVAILYDHQNISDPEQIIKHFNCGGETISPEELGNYSRQHPEKVSSTLIDDVCLTALQ